MAAEFDAHLKSCLLQLSTNVAQDGSNIHLKNAAILETKTKLLEICWEKALEYLVNNSTEIKPVFDKIRKFEQTVTADSARVYGSLITTSEQIRETKQEMENSMQSPEQMSNMKAKLEENKTETQQVLEIAEGLEKDLDLKKAELAKTKEIHEQHLNEL